MHGQLGLVYPWVQDQANLKLSDRAIAHNVIVADMTGVTFSSIFGKASHS
jgi:hypothetical protein